MGSNNQAFIQATLKKVNAIAYKKAYAICRDAAIAWESWFNLKFFEAKSGVQYRYRNRRGLLHHASAGGKSEYPADKTGKLLDSIKINLGSFNPNSKFIRIYLNTNVSYAKDLMKTRKLFQESKEEFFVKYFRARLSKG